MTESTSMTQSLGELIRERRLGLGLSLGQLATKVSTSAAEVRRWERGEQTPSEENQAVLAEMLGVEADAMANLAAEIELPDPVAPETPTEIVSAAAGVSLTSVSQPERPVDASEPVVETTVSESAEEIDVLIGGSAAPSAPPLVTPLVAPEDERVETTPPPFEDPTAPRPVPLKYPESVPVGVPVEIAEPEPNLWNPLRYLYDPEKPWLYWVRAGLTVVVLLILVNVLFDSTSELFDKIGEVFDSIEPTDAVEGDDQSVE